MHTSATLADITDGDRLPTRPQNRRRRLRRRSRWATVLLAVVAVAAGGWGVYVYGALNADMLSVDHLNVLSTGPGDKPGVETIRNALGDDHVVDYQRRGAFVVDLRLANTGVRDVTVERIPAERYYYFKIDRVRLERPGSGGFQAFSPFTLAPGESRRLEVRFVFPDCDLASEHTCLRACQRRTADL